ncbi:MAG: hypothetical protein K0S17_899 [Enterobacter mori]|jgi:tRNA(fMet)-specific endonuclease VapC|nr:hypothetical protein [Enterobacter mori]
MLHMLDTNIVSHLVRQHPEVLNQYSRIAPEKNVYFKRNGG